MSSPSVFCVFETFYRVGRLQKDATFYLYRMLIHGGKMSLWCSLED